MTRPRAGPLVAQDRAPSALVAALWWTRAARGADAAGVAAVRASSPARSSRSWSARCRSSRRRCSPWPPRCSPACSRRPRPTPASATARSCSSSSRSWWRDAVVKCGLGTRGGPLDRQPCSADRRSACRTASSCVDALIAPAFPSNTARSGVLYPLAFSLADAAGATPDRPERRRRRRVPDVLGHREPQRVVGALADGDGGQPARRRDRARRSASRSGSVAGCSPRRCRRSARWRCCRSCSTGVIGPEVTATPEAPAAARQALAALGPLTRAREDRARRRSPAWWRSGRRPRRSALDSTAVAFLGLGVLLATGVLTLERHRQAGRRARDVHLVRRAVHAEQPAERARVHGLSRPNGSPARSAGCASPTAGLVLVVAYVLLHYLFVSQTAHLLALFGVFLDVGVKLGVQPRRRSRSSCCSRRTTSRRSRRRDRARTCCLPAAGILSQGDLYRLGAITTAVELR